jgi:hypothetical protein
MTEREIWFRRDRSDRMINLPVHWKGWVTVAVVQAIILPTVGFMAYAEAYFTPQEQEFVNIGGWVVIAATLLGMIIVIARHKGDPDTKSK